MQAFGCPLRSEGNTAQHSAHTLSITIWQMPAYRRPITAEPNNKNAHTIENAHKLRCVCVHTHLLTPLCAAQTSREEREKWGCLTSLGTLREAFTVLMCECVCVWGLVRHRRGVWRASVPLWNSSLSAQLLDCEKRIPWEHLAKNRKLIYTMLYIYNDCRERQVSKHTVRLV